MTLPFYSCSYLEPRFKMSSGKVSHPCRRCVIRELKQRWRRGQRERQQSNRLKLTKDNNLKQLCTCITLYCTFPCRHCTTLTWKCLISPFVRGSEPTRQRLSFSFPELQYSLLKFHFQKKNCQHLTKWTRWNKHDKVWGSDTPIFKWRFRSRRRCRRCCLSSQFR